MEIEEAEPITQEEHGRTTLYPLRDPEVFEMYKVLESMRWVAQEPDLRNDRQQWQVLSPDERRFYGFILAMFAFADELVIGNLASSCMEGIKWLEMRYFYMAQIAQEMVHSESYSLQVQVCMSPEEQAWAIEAIRKEPSLARLAAWGQCWMDKTKPLGIRLAAVALFEGVAFQGQFMAFQLLRDRNILIGLQLMNELISRDEWKHFLFFCFLLRKRLRRPPTRAQVMPILLELVILMDDFFAAAMDNGRAQVTGITLPRMQTYLRYVADTALETMGFPPHFGVENPFTQSSKMLLNAETKVNFFELRVTQYNRDYDLKFRVDPARLALPAPDFLRG